MDTLSAKQKINLRKWTALIKQREESGLTVKEWCLTNHIDRRTYYYWVEKLRTIAVELTDANLPQTARNNDPVPSIVELRLPDEGSSAKGTDIISLTKEDLYISLPVSIGEEVILAVIREVLTCS